MLHLLFALLACESATPLPLEAVHTDCDDAPDLEDGHALVGDNLMVVDNDGDGFGTTVDCDDDDDEVGPRVTAWTDYDRDGFGGEPVTICPQWYEFDVGGVMVTKGGDCDDANQWAYPGAPELCDLVDNDCDGLPDDYDPEGVDPAGADAFWLDIDGDGFGRAYTEEHFCTRPYGWAPNDNDCDDDDWRVHPGAPGWRDCE